MRRLRDLEDRAQSGNDAAVSSGEGAGQNASVLRIREMIRTHSAWQDACAAALSELDEHMLLARVGCAIDALQMRFAEWGDDPGSSEELKAILQCIREMDQLLSEHSINKLPVHGCM